MCCFGSFQRVLHASQARKDQRSVVGEAPILGMLGLRLLDELECFFRSIPFVIKPNQIFQNAQIFQPCAAKHPLGFLELTLLDINLRKRPRHLPIFWVLLVHS